LVASFGGFGAGMVNDVEVTQDGDVYLTDSLVPTLWHVSAAQIAAGGGAPAGIPVGPEIPYDLSPFTFNLNGIAALRGGKSLIVDATNSGKLYRIDLDPRAPMGRVIQEIAVEPLPGADGLQLDGSDLLVVSGNPATLNVIRLDGKLEQGRVVERRTDPAMPESSGVTRARNYYLVVNFDLFNGNLPHTVVGLPRNFGEN
jgi:sugar lactone lactonase YvrE